MPSRSRKFKILIQKDRYHSPHKILIPASNRAIEWCPTPTVMNSPPPIQLTNITHYTWRCDIKSVVAPYDCRHGQVIQLAKQIVSFIAAAHLHKANTRPTLGRGSMLFWNKGKGRQQLQMHYLCGCRGRQPDELLVSLTLHLWMCLCVRTSSVRMTRVGNAKLYIFE